MKQIALYLSIFLWLVAAFACGSSPESESGSPLPEGAASLKSQNDTIGEAPVADSTVIAENAPKAETTEPGQENTPPKTKAEEEIDTAQKNKRKQGIETIEAYFKEVNVTQQLAILFFEMPNGDNIMFHEFNENSGFNFVTDDNKANKRWVGQLFRIDYKVVERLMKNGDASVSMKVKKAIHFELIE